MCVCVHLCVYDVAITKLYLTDPITGIYIYHVCMPYMPHICQW